MPKKVYYPGESEEYPEYEPDEEVEVEEPVDMFASDEEDKEMKLLDEELARQEQLLGKEEKKRERKDLLKEKKRDIRKVKYRELYQAGEKAKEISEAVGRNIGATAVKVAKTARGTPEQRQSRKQQLMGVIEKVRETQSSRSQAHAVNPMFTQDILSGSGSSTSESGGIGMTRDLGLLGGSSRGGGLLGGDNTPGIFKVNLLGGSQSVRLRAKPRKSKKRKSKKKYKKRRR